jgi:hypothetical protein
MRHYATDTRSCICVHSCKRAAGGRWRCGYTGVHNPEDPGDPRDIDIGEEVPAGVRATGWELGEGGKAQVGGIDREYDI